MVGQGGVGGAGASVSSGAGYQARVAAFVLISSICEADTIFGPAKSISHVSFETRTSIDDLVLHLNDGSKSYIQAKATIGFSADGELKSVFQQFEAQDAAASGEERYFLVTSSRAAKRVTNELRLALEAFRSSPEVDFLRDQPQPIKNAIQTVRAMLNELRVAAKRDVDPEAIDRVIRKSGVVVLDVEAEETLEQSSILLLQSANYVSPRAVWGKAVADCITFAKGRRTLAVCEFARNYQMFRVTAAAEISEAVATELLRVELGSRDFPCAKEVVLAMALDDTLAPKGQPVVFEMRRFDSEGRELADFSKAPFLPNGAGPFDPVLRAATVAGLTRLIGERPELIEGNEVGVVELDTDEDLEAGPFALAHRQRLHNAFLQNDRPLRCLHCGQAIWEAVIQVVEIGDLSDPVVGLVHNKCLKPRDRVIGGANMPSAQAHPELVNFNANAWFEASNGGQRTFMNAQTIRTQPVVNLAWNNLAMRGPAGQFLVELKTTDGGSEIVTLRNGLHRFTRNEAEQAVNEFNAAFERQRQSGDPMCYTDISKGFAPRSLLIQQFGAREKRREVAAASVRPYDRQLEDLHTRPGQWYAPLLYLRDKATEQPVAVGGGVLMLTDPMTLKEHLANWEETGFEIGDYELVAILSDAEFDNFMLWADAEELIVVVDALFDPSTQEIASGAIVMAMHRLSALKKQPKS